MNELTLIPQAFEYNGRAIRVVMQDGEPWFVAKDVCEVLEHTNSRMALERLDDDEKGVSTVYTPGGPQEMAVVNEAGLYALVMTSRLPEAKAFRRWITHDVLPQIRRTGAYVQQPASLEDLIIMQAQSVKELKARVAQLEDKATTALHRIDSLDTANINGDLQQRLDAMIKRYAWKAGILYSQAWHRFDQAWNMAFRSNLTALRENYCRRHGLRSISRPEYLDQSGHIEDAIRIADKLLASVTEASNG